MGVEKTLLKSSPTLSCTPVSLMLPGRKLFLLALRFILATLLMLPFFLRVLLRDGVAA